MKKELLARKAKTITVESGAFAGGDPIPEAHACDGADRSPPLEIRGVPEGARALALVMEDPDAPRGTFTHWTLWNLPPREARIEAGADVTALGAREGTNDFGDVGYRGPCPPSGTHRYFIRVFALDGAIDLPRGAKPPQVARALEGRALAWGELMGTYAAR